MVVRLVVRTERDTHAGGRRRLPVAPRRATKRTSSSSAPRSSRPEAVPQGEEAIGSRLRKKSVRRRGQCPSTDRSLRAVRIAAKIASVMLEPGPSVR